LRVISFVVQVLEINPCCNLIDLFGSPFLPFGVRCEKDGRVGQGVGCSFVTSKIVAEQVAVDLGIGQVAGTLALLVLILRSAHQDTHEVVLLLCASVHGLALLGDHLGHVLTEVDNSVLDLLELGG
jgi:hypothetical protein